MRLSFAGYAFHNLTIDKMYFPPFTIDRKAINYNDIASRFGILRIATRRKSMISLRQIEALYWIVELGTFERAAQKLNTTQSAISKRVKELEMSTGLEIFDRSQRGAKLTLKGEEVLAIGQSMMELQDRILSVRENGSPPARRLRVGVTELSALTWLPRLITRLRELYPTVIIEPDVDHARTLHERLVENELDIVIMPEVFLLPDVTAVRVGEVINCWMASPSLFDYNPSVEQIDLSEHLVLTQGRKSGSGIFYENWLKSNGITFARTLTCANLLAQVSFAVAGLGIGYFPQHCFNHLQEDGKLIRIKTNFELPSVPYAVVFRNDRPSLFLSNVAEIAREVCNFEGFLHFYPRSA